MDGVTVKTAVMNPTAVSLCYFCLNNCHNIVITNDKNGGRCLVYCKDWQWI